MSIKKLLGIGPNKQIDQNFSKALGFKSVFWGLIYLFASGIIFLSLVSFDVTDASIFHHSCFSVVNNNILGAFGASCASILLYLFGCSAFLFAIIFGLLSAMYLNVLNYKNNIDRVWSLCGLILINSTIFLLL